MQRSVCCVVSVSETATLLAFYYIVFYINLSRLWHYFVMASTQVLGISNIVYTITPSVTGVHYTVHIICFE